jgi:hypothetical protein
MAAVWPIGPWRRGDGGGTVKKESIVQNVVYVLCINFKVVKLFLKHPVFSLYRKRNASEHSKITIYCYI